MGRIYVALDLETTGLDSDNDQIIEIGAVKFEVGDAPTAHKALDSFETLVNPRRKITYRITHLTGITQEDVDNAPPLTAVLPTLERFIDDHPIVGHNVQFDLGFLRRRGVFQQRTHSRRGVTALDTFELATVLVPGSPRYSLGKLADHLGVAFPTRHRAADDAHMVYQLFVALWEKACHLPQDVLRAVTDVAMKSDWSLQQFFADALRVQGIGNTEAPARARHRRLRPPRPRNTRGDDEVTPPDLDVEALRRLLSVTGPLAKTFVAFEERPQQVAMLEAVARAFNAGEHLLVEAGTGTGKSLAYLVPAVQYAVEADEPVIISTNTINLQEQLFHEDLPRLQETLDVEFNVALLKGRNNYVCPRRVREFLTRDTFTTEEARLLARVLVWLPQTETGDRSELLILREEAATWQYICADQQACRLNNCAFGDRCFFYHARAMAEGAHILVINHALLLSDLAMDNMLLPDHRHVIIDEAHHLEDRATDHLGGTVRKKSTLDFLKGLTAQQRGRPPGALALLRSRLQAADAALSENRRQHLRGYVGSLVRGSEQAYRAASRFFAAILAGIEPFMPRRSAYDAQVRLQPDVRMDGGWQRAREEATAFARILDLMSDDMYRLIQTLEELDPDAWAGTLNTLIIAHRTLQEVSAEVMRIVVEPEANDICWVRVSARYDDLYLRRAPLHVGELLQQSLFEKRRSVVLTSATLQTPQARLRRSGGFAYIRERLGLKQARELAVGSPFRYREAAFVYAPTDLPEPNTSKFDEAVGQGLVDLARATQGRMLVLCTSKAQLRRLYDGMSGPLALDDIIVLGQYLDGSRRQLIERFRTASRCVLLGTQSFWEGVDVPGEALSCLVITRLPFPVPSDPVIAARSETYNEPFYQYTVPQTILRFRQGFGRLIRSQQDRGVVAIMDTRVTTKSYGRHFVDALPACEIRFGRMSNLPPLAERWLAAETVEALRLEPASQ